MTCDERVVLRRVVRCIITYTIKSRALCGVVQFGHESGHVPLRIQRNETRVLHRIVYVYAKSLHEVSLSFSLSL
jgi:hypothetical protein